MCPNGEIEVPGAPMLVPICHLFNETLKKLSGLFFAWMYVYMVCVCLRVYVCASVPYVDINII